MNTVFKFYLQAWVLLSITAAVALGWLVRRLARDRAVAPGPPGVGRRRGDPRARGGRAIRCLASKAKVGLRFADLPLSLDGMQYMDFAQYLDDGQDLQPARRRAKRSAGCRTTSSARRSCSRAARPCIAGARASRSTPGCRRSWAGTSTRASSALATRA